jgi:hypothetical protein
MCLSSVSQIRPPWRLYKWTRRHSTPYHDGDGVHLAWQAPPSEPRLPFASEGGVDHSPHWREGRLYRGGQGEPGADVRGGACGTLDLEGLLCLCRSRLWACRWRLAASSRPVSRAVASTTAARVLTGNLCACPLQPRSTVLPTPCSTWPSRPPPPSRPSALCGVCLRLSCR